MLAVHVEDEIITCMRMLHAPAPSPAPSTSPLEHTTPSNSLSTKQCVHNVTCTACLADALTAAVRSRDSTSNSARSSAPSACPRASVRTSHIAQHTCHLAQCSHVSTRLTVLVAARVGTARARASRRRRRRRRTRLAQRTACEAIGARNTAASSHSLDCLRAQTESRSSLIDGIGSATLVRLYNSRDKRRQISLLGTSISTDSTADTTLLITVTRNLKRLSTVCCKKDVITAPAQRSHATIALVKESPWDLTPHFAQPERVHQCNAHDCSLPTHLHEFEHSSTHVLGCTGNLIVDTVQPRYLPQPYLHSTSILLPTRATLYAHALRFSMMTCGERTRSAPGCAMLAFTSAIRLCVVDATYTRNRSDHDSGSANRNLPTTRGSKRHATIAVLRDTTIQ
jgi:hypothetical protein